MSAETFEYTLVPTVDHSITVARVVLRHPEYGVLLLHRKPASHNNGGKWEIPGGRCEPDETTHFCAMREIREESGIKAAVNETFILVEDRPLRNGEPGTYRVYAALGTVWQGGFDITMDGENHDGYSWVPTDELRDFRNVTDATANALLAFDFYS